ncbi:MAG: hypothetical protein ACYTFG_00105 [Planctomycetota bacterium]|jgi:hypothetical protein
MKTKPAHLRFRRTRSGALRGELVEFIDALDKQNSMGPVKGSGYLPFFLIELCEGGYNITMQGGRHNGRRYGWEKTLHEAKHRGERWAGRRFRVPVELQPGDTYRDPRTGEALGRFIGHAGGVDHVWYPDKPWSFQDARERFLARHG